MLITKFLIDEYHRQWTENYDFKEGSYRRYNIFTYQVHLLAHQETAIEADEV